MKPTHLRTPALLLAGGLAAAACLTGCGTNLSGEHRRTVSYGVGDPVRTLVVHGDTGDIQVTGGGGGVHVTERQGYRRVVPHTTHTLTGTTLTLRSRCDDCSVSYDIRVPAGTAVDLVTDTGGVRLAGLSGAVRAGTATGGVTATGLSGSTVTLTTDTGSVDAAFTGAPTGLTARSGTGSVTLTVPGSTAYAVDATTGTGRADITVDRSGGSHHRITARVDTGDLTIRRG